MTDEASRLPGAEPPNRHDRFLFSACFVALVATSFAFIIRVMVMGDWQIEIHIVDAEGRELVGLAAEPVGGYPTGLWQAGDVWRGQFNLMLPGDTPPGSYRLRVQARPPEGPEAQPYLSEPIRVE